MPKNKRYFTPMSAQSGFVDGSEHRLFWLWLGLAAGLMVIDQITKVLITHNYALYEGMMVTSFFNIVRVHNTGAAFSFLADAGGWQRWFLTAISLGACGFMMWMLWQTSPQRRLFGLAIALILGGAAGNLVDRVIYGYVIDFLDVHASWLDGWFIQGHFPAFNVADSAISVGVGLFLIDELRSSKK